MTELYDSEVAGKNLELWSDRVDNSVFTFINTTTMRGKGLAAKAFLPADVSKKEIEQNAFMMENFLVHEVQLKDEKTGFKNLCVRTVLFDSEGRTAAFVSEGIYGALQRLVSLFGVAPWIPAIPVKLVESSTRMGNRVYSLEVVLEMLGDDKI